MEWVRGREDRHDGRREELGFYGNVSGLLL